MDNLINRQATLDKINERQRKLIYCFGFENDMVKIMDIAKSIVTAMPSAQPEIIKCKECQCFEIDKNGVNGFCTKHGICPDVYDYCSWAERKENGSD